MREIMSEEKKSDLDKITIDNDNQNVRYGEQLNTGLVKRGLIL